tara:strand:- start:341 stop:547 length:207 start_codon:yes stop_codon:yes gene_type:complete
MSSWKKFKNHKTGKEMLVQPIYDKQDYETRIELGTRIKIEDKEIILDRFQREFLICYLVRLQNDYYTP